MYILYVCIHMYIYIYVFFVLRYSCIYYMHICKMYVYIQKCICIHVSMCNIYIYIYEIIYSHAFMSTCMDLTKLYKVTNLQVAELQPFGMISLTSHRSIGSIHRCIHIYIEDSYLYIYIYIYTLFW